MTPSEVHSVNSPREGGQLLGIKQNKNDGVSQTPWRGKPFEHVPLKTRQMSLRIATWNMRSLWPSGRLESVLQEMEVMKLDILGSMRNTVDRSWNNNTEKNMT